MKDRGKVYVVQENPKLDYMDADSYGDVTFITGQEYSPMSGAPVNDRIVLAVRLAMQEFNPDRDYLLLTGGLTVVGYAFHLAIQKKGYINLLQWDKRRNSYVVIRFAP